MGSKNILQLHKKLTTKKSTSLYTDKLTTNPLKSKNKRPYSMSIEDAFFGDSGKGRITVEFNTLLAKKLRLFSLRYNGGANAGHECYIGNKIIVTHQLPIAIICDGATTMMGRGVVLHPQDLLTEIAEIKHQFGGKLPGKLYIDERAILSLDTHRALETVLNTYTTGGRGSTGRGIATAYGSFYERIAVTVKDLLSNNWKETFKSHYRLYEKLIAGFYTTSLADIDVARLSKPKETVGSEKAFLAKLQEHRAFLSEYTTPNGYTLLQTAWQNPKIGFTFEGAQGAGLDPFHGVYPDVTASRPASRNINDTTYNIIEPHDIAMRVAVMKTTYMSSVGKRILPTQYDKKQGAWIQQAFDEKGRSTGRLRDIYEVSIPLGKYFKIASGYDYLIATHLDASKKNTPIPIVTHYTHKKTKKEMPYLPFQDYLDQLDAHVVTFPGWDGEKAKLAKKPDQLPKETQQYLAFLSITIAPIALGTADPHIGNYISWIPRL